MISNFQIQENGVDLPFILFAHRTTKNSGYIKQSNVVYESERGNEQWPMGEFHFLESSGPPSLVAGGSQPKQEQPEAQEELFTPRQIPGTLSCQYKNFQIVSASLLMSTTENASTPLSAAKAK